MPLSRSTRPGRGCVDGMLESRAGSRRRLRPGVTVAPIDDHHGHRQSAEIRVGRHAAARQKLRQQRIQTESPATLAVDKPCQRACALANGRARLATGVRALPTGVRAGILEIDCEWVGRSLVACHAGHWRKVRASQDRMVDNVDRP